MEDKQAASDRIRDRNIVDMLRSDQSSGSKKNWKAFRDKLRLKRTGRAWTSSVPIPTSDIPIQNKSNRMMTKRGSWRYQTDGDGDGGGDGGESDGDVTQSIRLLPLETDPENDDGNDSPDGEQKQADGGDQVMSLMSLLSSDGSNYHEDEEEHVEEHQEAPEQQNEEEEAAAAAAATGDRHGCSGCAAKFKGTALGSCGHTFCKQCSKELHVSKGNCPTCNDYIIEILDIF